MIFCLESRTAGLALFFGFDFEWLFCLLEVFGVELLRLLYILII